MLETEGVADTAADAVKESGIVAVSRYAPAVTCKAPYGLDKWSVPNESAPDACAQPPMPSVNEPEK